MKKIIALGGSNSKKSINKALAVYAASLISDVEVITLDLNDFDLPLFGVDLEAEKGIAPDAYKLLKLIQDADGIVLSLAENNGSYSTAFKNAFDWMSRINTKLWDNIPMLLMSTSPGARGGASVLEAAKNGFSRMGGNIIATFSLPSFNNNFSDDKISDETLREELFKAVLSLEKSVIPQEL